MTRSNGYMSATDYEARYAGQWAPPRNGWVHGSWVLCAMRDKNTGMFYPSVKCCVWIERGAVYLLQDCCLGSRPSFLPEGLRHLLSWTIQGGGAGAMHDEHVVYLGPYVVEGRNPLCLEVATI